MSSKTKPKPAPRIPSSKELDAFAAKVKASGGSERGGYNHKSRNNLKQNRGC